MTEDIQVGPNPDYGTGIFRRRIRLVSTGNQVQADLEDCNHAFRLTLLHDGQQVTGITAEPIRFPFNTCPGALVNLQGFIGCALSASIPEIRQFVRPEQNCTHLYDLATLALAHVAHGRTVRQYDVAIPDERDGVLPAEVSCDGLLQHSWQIRQREIIFPPHLAGKPIMKGFYQWATAEFAGDALEAAEVLQRGYFVSHTRRLDLKSSVGRPAFGDRMPEGSCYSYNRGVVEHAFQACDNVRDFTDTPELLLRFV